MPTAVEILQKAQELRSQGQAGQLPSQASKALERLLRFSLYQATALDHLQNGAVIVFVLFAEALHKGMSAGYVVGPIRAGPAASGRGPFCAASSW